MIVLLGDGIQSLYPEFDLMTTRAISLCILTPTVFLPIKKLAYTSLIGIIGCISLVIIVSYDGLSKKTQPGSLYDPMVHIFMNYLFLFCMCLFVCLRLFRVQKLFQVIFPIFP